MSALATAAPKSFNGKFTAKIDFPIGHFILPLLMLTMKSKVSPYIVWYLKYLDHMLAKFEQIVWFELTKNFVLSDNKEMVNHFWQSVDAIFEDVSVSGTNKDYRLSVFQKLQYYDTCNQVKSCTKHGRPNQSQRKQTVALNAQCLVSEINNVHTRFWSLGVSKEVLHSQEVEWIVVRRKGSAGVVWSLVRMGWGWGWGWGGILDAM